MRELEAKVAMLEQQQGQPMPQVQPQMQQPTTPALAPTTPQVDVESGFINVESEQEAWAYEDWRIMAGQTLYFLNQKGGAIYSKKFDANIPTTIKNVYVLQSEPLPELEPALTLEVLAQEIKEIKELILNDKGDNPKDSAKGVGKTTARGKGKSNAGSDASGAE